MRCPHCHREITEADLRRDALASLTREELLERIEKLRREGSGDYRTGRSWGKPRPLSNRSLAQLRAMYERLSGSH